MSNTYTAPRYTHNDLLTKTKTNPNSNPRTFLKFWPFLTEKVDTVGSIKNKRHKHSLPINSTNFKKVLGLGLGIELVLVSKDSRVHYLILNSA